MMCFRKKAMVASNDVAMEFGTMDFGEVLRRLKAEPTKRFARIGWNGKGQYIQMQVPDEHSKMTVPYLYIKTAQDALVPWIASQTDMLAEDWIDCSE